MTYKTCLLSQGFTQRKNVDYNKTFFPVVKYSSIRILLSPVTNNDMYLEQLDIKMVFFHGELEEKIYTRQPKGFVQKDNEDHVFLLRKSLYDLRQWYKRFDSYMIKLGFQMCERDNYVY